MKVGDTVKYLTPYPGEENARYVIVEWNGDRGFGRLVCDMVIPPVTLLHEEDIEVAEVEA